MAERRMFAKTIVTSDAFLDMPLSTRCLYFTLAMLADDEGFVNNPKSIMRQVGASMDDLNILIAKRFILTFESGVIVIKHWKIHNYIAKDRYKETKYIEERSQITVDSNGAYTECIQDVYKLETQVRLGKDSLGKDSVVEDSIDDASPTPSPKPTRHKYGMYKNVLLSDEDYQKLQEEFPHDYSERIDKLSEYIESTGKKYKNHLAVIRAWARKDNSKPAKENSSNPFLEMLKEEGGFQ